MITLIEMYLPFVTKNVIMSKYIFFLHIMIASTNSKKARKEAL